jgi:hypothetical protein
MDKFRKKFLIEVVEIYENGDRLVQNEGDPSDQWIINKELFEKSYIKEVSS